MAIKPVYSIALIVAFVLFDNAAAAHSYARVERVAFLGQRALRLTDGQTEALVVPRAGRVMRYGKVGGPNLLWYPTRQSWRQGQNNHGGIKTWLAPQSYWRVFHGARYGIWPPDPALDGDPYAASILPGAKICLRSNASHRTGIRVEKTIAFAQDGDLLITLTARKVAGAPVRAALWVLLDVLRGEAVYAPSNPESPYRNRCFNLVAVPDDINARTAISQDLMRLEPRGRFERKLGFDAPVAAIASVRNGSALIATEPLRPGQYPDGALGAGFPVEFYSDPAQPYYELELLGALTDAVAGTFWTQTVRLSVRDLPSQDARSAETVEAVRQLFAATRTRSIGSPL